MIETQNIFCEQCKSSEYEFDKYYKEFSCKNCGKIVEDKNKIASIEKYIRSKDSDISKDSLSEEETIKTVFETNFNETVLENSIPTVVHFSLDSEFDAQMQPLLESLARSLTSKATFATVNISENTNLCEKYGISLAPTLLFVVTGKVVGYIIGIQTAEDLKLKVSTMLEKPADDHKEIDPGEIKKASKAAQPSGEWSNALTSGLVAGLVFLFSRTKLEGAATLIVPGLAMAFFITNSNFRFSFAQKAFAIVLMLVIGTYGSDIMKFLMSH